MMDEVYLRFGSVTGGVKSCVYSLRASCVSRSVYENTSPPVVPLRPQTRRFGKVSRYSPCCALVCITPPACHHSVEVCLYSRRRGSYVIRRGGRGVQTYGQSDKCISAHRRHLAHITVCQTLWALDIRCVSRRLWALVRCTSRWRQRWYFPRRGLWYGDLSALGLAARLWICVVAATSGATLVRLAYGKMPCGRMKGHEDWPSWPALLYPDWTFSALWRSWYSPCDVRLAGSVAYA